MSNPWVALQVGTDARDAARSLARAHTGFVTTGLTGGVRDVVLASWQRSACLGSGPDAALPRSTSSTATSRSTATRTRSPP